MHGCTNFARAQHLRRRLRQRQLSSHPNDSHQIIISYDFHTRNHSIRIKAWMKFKRFVLQHLFTVTRTDLVALRRSTEHFFWVIFFFFSLPFSLSLSLYHSRGWNKKRKIIYIDFGFDFTCNHCNQIRLIYSFDFFCHCFKFS